MPVIHDCPFLSFIQKVLDLTLKINIKKAGLASFGARVSIKFFDCIPFCFGVENLLKDERMIRDPPKLSEDVKKMVRVQREQERRMGVSPKPKNCGHWIDEVTKLGSKLKYFKWFVLDGRR